MSKVLWTVLCLIAFVGMVLGIMHNLDKPTPVRGDRGQIVAFDTPEGRIENIDPEFAKMLADFNEQN